MTLMAKKPLEPQSISEFDSFEALAQKLLTVSKGELDAMEAVRKAAKRGEITAPND